MGKALLILALILFLGSITLSGCIQEGAATGVLILQITDAPAKLDISKALVPLPEICLLGLSLYLILVGHQLFAILKRQSLPPPEYIH